MANDKSALVISEEVSQIGGFWVSADSPGYGVSGSLCLVTEVGVTTCATLSGCEISECEFSEKEHKEALNHISSSTEEDYDDEVIEMVQAGCEPEKIYWVLDREFCFGDEREFFDSFGKAMDALGEIADAASCDAEEVLWRDMPPEEIKQWLDVVREHKKTQD